MSGGVSKDLAAQAPQLSAGRDLDALVAERVMGDGVQWMRTALSDNDPHQMVEGHKGWGRVPSYSTSIASAWLVVEKMDEWKFEVSRHNGQSEGVTRDALIDGERQRVTTSRKVHPARPYYRVLIMKASREHYGCWSGSAEARADTAPLAICIAALRATELRSAATPTEEGR